MLCVICCRCVCKLEVVIFVSDGRRRRCWISKSQSRQLWENRFVYTLGPPRNSRQSLSKRAKVEGPHHRRDLHVLHRTSSSSITNVGQRSQRHKMSYNSHPKSRQTILPSQMVRDGATASIRPGSGLGQSNNHQSALQARVNEKRLELESLKQLRDLSAGLAGQMQQLEEKLITLSDGTEAVAAVMGNWNTVLRAVYMASQAIPKPKAEGDIAGDKKEDALPQTLVRIPIQQAQAVQREQAEREANAG